MAVNCDAVNCDYNNGQVCGNECFDIMRSRKTYTVPCTKQVCEAYTVQVPKTRAITVNKQEPYIDYETHPKQVPFHYVDRRTITRSVPTCRTFPIIKNVCTSVPMRSRGLLGRQCYVKKKCPRTVYVRKKVCQQRQFCQSIPRIGWKTVQESRPVKKFRNKTEVQYKTETVPERRYRTRTVTKMVNKTVPVYTVVTKPQHAGQQEDMLVQTIPAPDEPTVLPALRILPDHVIADAGAASGYSSAAFVPANFVESKPGAGTSVNDYGIYQEYPGAEAVHVNGNMTGIGENHDGKLSYEQVIPHHVDAIPHYADAIPHYADAHQSGYLAINKHKTYGTLNTYGDVSDGKHLTGNWIGH